eukprot:TRINITY_DN23922_c0_g1_i1.p1 TRINITY_DN23922_c0_g1~~TRINITY_DN23922_c0_g1_i1.p1  ORF type:complete len:233 (+),score=39.37 TRINITY_DN23922_c0_g1_i1:68-766(+)
MALSPVECFHLLLQERLFERTYAKVYEGLRQGSVDVCELVTGQVVIPLQGHVHMTTLAVRSRASVTAELKAGIASAVQERFLDDEFTERIAEILSLAVAKAEADRPALDDVLSQAEQSCAAIENVFGRDAASVVQLSFQTSVMAPRQLTVAKIQGSLKVRRVRVSPSSERHVCISLDLTVQALLLNRTTLARINEGRQDLETQPSCVFSPGESSAVSLRGALPAAAASAAVV